MNDKMPYFVCFFIIKELIDGFSGDMPSMLKSDLEIEASHTGNRTSIQPKDNSSENIQLFFSKQLLLTSNKRMFVKIHL